MLRWAKLHPLSSEAVPMAALPARSVATLEVVLVSVLVSVPELTERLEPVLVAVLVSEAVPRDTLEEEPALELEPVARLELEPEPELV